MEQELTAKEFYKDLLEAVKVDAEDQQVSLEQQLTSQILEYIREEGIITTPTYCFCQNEESSRETDTNYYKINAFDYEEEAGILDLIVTNLYDNAELPEFGKRRIETMHNAAYCFFRKAVESDELIKKYRDSNPDLHEFVFTIHTEYAKRNIKLVRIFILSNGVVNPNYVHPSELTIGKQEIECEINIWDLETVRQCEVAQRQEGAINIDLDGVYHSPLSCVQCPSANGAPSYLAIMPGIVLAQIYKQYRVKLLNQNVRNYLGGKVKINKNMLKTLREDPGMFFAYNNGISSTATQVSFRRDSNGELIQPLTITNLHDWQIVNGGQTTNTIYSLYRNEKDALNDVYIAMKVTEIPVTEKAKHADTVGCIARYANSQNQVKESDLAANENYMRDMENMSRSIVTPINSARKNTHWFFIRMRGQYEEKKGCLSKRKGNEFMKENPPKQAFAKTDLAKWEMAWLQKPWLASRGGELCFDKFWKEVVAKEKIEVTEDYFHRLIAKAILYERIENICKEAGQKGYVNIICNYVLAILAMKSKGKLDLNVIWNEQKVPQALTSHIKKAVDIVADYIQSIAKDGADLNNINPSVVAKKEEFWKTICLRVTNMPEIERELLEAKKDEELSADQKKLVESFNEVEQDVWDSLVGWGKTSRKLSLLERKRIEHVAAAKLKDKMLSFSYIQDAMNILKKSKDLGWVNK